MDESNRPDDSRPIIAHSCQRDGTTLVSVVITCYNQAHFLSEAIESVLSQTYRIFEIIVIDDGSADHPEQIASKYSMVCFVGQQNRGVSAARNSGWRRSKGEFLVFLDADDRLLPNALQAGLTSLNNHPACAFTFGAGRLIDAAGKPLPTPLQTQIENYGYRQLLEGNSMPFPALVMHRRSAFETVGGFNSFVKNAFIGDASDYDLYLRIASNYPIQGHDELIAEWRQHGANTSRKSLLMLESCVAVLNGQRKLIGGDRQRLLALERGLKRVVTHYGEQLIQELRAQVKSGEINWLHFTRSLMVLLKLYPSGLIENALRKGKVTVFGFRAPRNDRSQPTD